jgi:hypothetical protein
MRAARTFAALTTWHVSCLPIALRPYYRRQPPGSPAPPEVLGLVPRTPEAFVSDGGTMVKANQAVRMYTQLDRTKEQVEARKAWQEALEALPLRVGESA